MSTAPRRRGDIIITDLGTEHVMLDPTTEVAHAVTPQAAAIFAACDGARSTDDIASTLGVTRADVQAALAEFDDAGLLAPTGVSRRAVLAGAGVAGAAVLTSVVMPAARAAASTTGNPPPTGSVTYNLFTVAQSYVSAQTQTGPFFFRYGTSAPGTNATDTFFTATHGGTANGFHGGEGDFPYFYAVTGGQYDDGTVHVPINKFAVHPGPNQFAIIKFVTPSAGTVVFNGSVHRYDHNGGNGTTTSVVDASNNPPTEGAIARSTASFTVDPAPFTATFSGAHAGDAFYVIVNNNGDYGYDTTGVDLTVTVTP